MAEIKVLICDICKVEERSDKEVYWALKHSSDCRLKIGKDGGNMEFEHLHTFCVNCRSEIISSLNILINNIRGKSNEKI